MVFVAIFSLNLPLKGYTLGTLGEGGAFYSLSVINETMKLYIDTRNRP